MKIIELPKILGTLFIVETSPTKTLTDYVSHGIGRWLTENNIQYTYTHVSLYEDEYFIRDEAGIMAFKLRWM